MMNKIYTRRFFAITLLLLASCSTDNRTTQEDYFDLHRFLEEQVNRLAPLNPTIQRTTAIGGKQETKTLQLSAAKWEKELIMFSNANINKPSLKGLYEVDSTLSDTYKVVSYQTKDNAKTGVRYMKVYYKQEEVAKVEVLFQEKAIIYYAKRKLWMTFEKNGEGPPLLSTYAIDGHQKIIFQDPVDYRVEARVIYQQ